MFGKTYLEKSISLSPREVYLKSVRQKKRKKSMGARPRHPKTSEEDRKSLAKQLLTELKPEPLLTSAGSDLCTIGP